MKKLAVLFVTFLVAWSVGYGQTQKSKMVPLKKLTGKEVSSLAKNNFIADFGNLPNVTWARMENFDQVTFMKGNVKMTAYYDSEGNLVGTTEPKTFADLPDKGQKEIKAKYANYKVEAVTFFDDNEKNDTDMVLWSTQFDDEDLYFAELSKGASTIVVRVTPSGGVDFFKTLK